MMTFRVSFSKKLEPKRIKILLEQTTITNYSENLNIDMNPSTGHKASENLLNNNFFLFHQKFALHLTGKETQICLDI